MCFVSGHMRRLFLISFFIIFCIFDKFILFQYFSFISKMSDTIEDLENQLNEALAKITLLEKKNVFLKKVSF